MGSSPKDSRSSLRRGPQPGSPNGQFETWLSRMVEDQPYLGQEENLANRRLFNLCASSLVNVIEERVAACFKEALGQSFTFAKCTSFHSLRCDLQNPGVVGVGGVHRLSAGQGTHGNVRRPSRSRTSPLLPAAINRRGALPPRGDGESNEKILA